MTDSLGDRMKMYEKAETGRIFMPGLPVYARIDGRSFSKFTKDMNRPFDGLMTACMVETTRYLVENTNAIIGYCQSDEISLAWYVENTERQVFFNGKIQKLVSVLAAMASVKFATLAHKEWPDLVEEKLPAFDCRVFQLPNKSELANAFLWRELDATKNAISMAARSLYEHKELHGKSGSEMQEMMFLRGINFNDYPAFFKRGSFIRNEEVELRLSDDDFYRIPEEHRPLSRVVKRHQVMNVMMPPFRTVTNRIGVIFDGEKPEIDS